MSPSEPGGELGVQRATHFAMESLGARNRIVVTMSLL
jgi:hypothetical protein